VATESNAMASVGPFFIGGREIAAGGTMAARLTSCHGKEKVTWRAAALF
jgi:hypothetical protein